MGEFLKHSYKFRFTYEGKLDGKDTKGEIIAGDKYEAAGKLKQKNIILTAPLIKAESLIVNGENRNRLLSPDPKLFGKSLILSPGYLFVIWMLLNIVISKINEEFGPLITINLLWVVFFTAFPLVYQKFRIKNLLYEMKDSSITLHRGIFTKIEQNIPYNKVTDFILHRDLMDRFLGIGSIKVETAGNSGGTGFDGILEGLEDYEEIHKILRNKLNESQNPNQTYKNTDALENDSVLTDILLELKEINNKLKK